MRLTALLLLLVFSFSVFAAEDEKIFGATFPATYILYILKPDSIIGWNASLRDREKKYIPEKYQKLPVVGGWYGQGIVPDKEVLIGNGVKRAFFITNNTTDSAIRETLKELKIESISMRGVSIQDYIDIFRAMGEELGVAERGNALASFAEESIADVADMMEGYPPDKRVKVYFVQGGNGLETFCDGSYRAEAINMAGGELVHKCGGSIQDIVTISFEQLMRYDPDVILIQEPVFAEKFSKDVRWQRLRAAKQGRVFVVPYEPYGWLDRPPSYMRFLGVPWLVCKMHPDRCSVDLDNETKRFMKLFFRIDITDEQLNGILLK